MASRPVFKSNPSEKMKLAVNSNMSWFEGGDLALVPPSSAWPRVGIF